jgi:ferrochelatase
MIERLDALSPATAPHRFYVAFRYAAPFAEDAVRAMRADGITRAVAFSQYPQYSCTTTGSSLNELWRALDREGLTDAFEWSLIDRWPTHPGFVRAMGEAVEEGLQQYAPRERDDVLLMFSAHSLPLSVIDRGDAYPQEVGATVERVMETLGARNPYMLTYQSEVGPVRWLGPSTEGMIRRLASDQRKNVLVVPVAFTSDHIETLSEIDIEYAELAHELGLTGFRRAPSLNTRPAFLDAMADIVRGHLVSGDLHHAKYRERCPGCRNPSCRQLPSPAVETARALAVA